MAMAASDDAIVLVGAARTPMGGFLGTLSPVRAPDLGGAAIAGALSRAGLSAEQVDEVIMGCVLPAGVGQAPARQAAFAAGLGEAVACTTINKMCGSGMKAVMSASDALAAGTARCVIAGGMESMSNAPYLLDRGRSGYRMGHGTVLDHMFLDGLEDAYDKGRLMGTFAEQTATHFGFDRQAQDDYALESLERARRASDDGTFADEIVPVTVSGRKGETVVATDEQPAKAVAEKIPTLKPAFARDGTVTAANSSSISDGGAALVLTRRSVAEREGLEVLAELRAQVVHAQAPAWFTTAPIQAITKVLERAGWRLSDVDLFEVNEAFAVVAMAAMRELNIARDRINIHGGACALGHPIGASGARIIVTLLNAMARTGARRGVAAICIGGGEATAVAVERP